MLDDAHKVLASLRATLKDGQYTGNLFVMGRSMGRHAAFEIAANAKEPVKGLIIESGRPSLGQFTQGLTDSDAQVLQAAYQAKVRSIRVPVLVIHGEWDTLAPVEEAVSMFQEFPSPEKRLLTIPGAGHNDLMHVGIQEYFAAIRDFVSG